jgi:two-component system, sensor histidine kinase LadS
MSENLRNFRHRLLASMLISGVSLGILFDTVTYLQRGFEGYWPLVPKFAVYAWCISCIFLNRSGRFRPAAYGALIALSLYSVSTFHFGTAIEPTLAATLAVVVAAILLTPYEAVGILFLNLGLWVMHGLYGESIFGMRPSPPRSLANETVDLLLYGLILLALQAVVTHLLRQTLRSLESARHEAVEASSAKSRFLSHVSHELRTPVSGVIGLLRLASKRDLDPEARREIQQALFQAETQLGIINDLLDLAKIEAGRFSIQPAPFEPRALFGDPLFALRQQAEAKGLQVGIQIDEALPKVLMGDSQRLGQIVLNLMSNAVKFTHSGAVTLQVKALPGSHADAICLRIEVADTGIGIAPDAMRKLFKAFERGDAEHSRTFGGTGLGLAISHSLALAMGGEITVRGMPGRGSIFTFEAPFEIAKPAGDEATLKPAAPLQVLKHRLRVLVVEDVEVNRYIALSMLEALGQSATSVENGREACLRLGEERFDLVLMDLRMPVMEGQEAARIIRSGGLEECAVLDSQVPIVALTANATEADQKACIEAGMDGFLVKPLREAALRAQLTQAAASQMARGFVLPLVMGPSVQSSASWVPALPQTDSSDAGSSQVNRSQGNDSQAGPSVSNRLLELWPQEASKRLSALRDALTRQDLQALAREAHSLKGAAGYLELASLRDISSRLEEACDAQSRGGRSGFEAMGFESAEIERLAAGVEAAVMLSLASSNQPLPAGRSS